MRMTHPDVIIWAAAIDSHLDDHGYIVPVSAMRAIGCSAQREVGCCVIRKIADFPRNIAASRRRASAVRLGKQGIRHKCCGTSIAASFELFGLAHLGAIALTFMTPLILCAISRWCGSIATSIVSWLFVALLVGDKIFWFILLRRDGQLTIETAAPMQLCDWRQSRR